MPELPEVEWVVRSLNRTLPGKTVRDVTVLRPRPLRPTAPDLLCTTLTGATTQPVERRGKFMIFRFTQPGTKKGQGPLVCAHLGMTGRMDVVPNEAPIPKHLVVSLDLGRERFDFVDPRGFGRFSLDATPLDRLGPEPLSDDFTPPVLAEAMKGSKQAIKVSLLDQSRLAGVGNIYASESLFLAGIHPKRPAGGLREPELVRLHAAIQTILNEAIASGSHETADPSNPLFYYGEDGASGSDSGAQRFRVYDHAGEPCPRCGNPIERLVQAARSTFFCAGCQPLRPAAAKRR